MLLVVVFVVFVFSPTFTFASANIFTHTLYVGMRGEDVRELQKFLNTDVETRIADSGAGSAGNETDYFGPVTKRALIKFQEKYSAEILVPVALSSGTGILGAKTRDKINILLKIADIPKQEQMSVGFPVLLKIPKINVGANIVYVGLTSQGAMDVPKDPANAAWFSLGVRPGEIGSAVISGHFGWKNNIPAIFDNLHALQSGDKIYVEDENGIITTFVVREIRTYGENEDASDVFGSSDGKAHLNLVTCEGTWNKIRKSYSNRLVVFTDKETE